MPTSTIYMNRKPNEAGKVPDSFETLDLIISLGFKEMGPLHDYGRYREVEGVKVLDTITPGFHLCAGKTGELEAQYANYYIESGASHEGTEILQKRGKNIEEIFQFHQTRLLELEEELRNHFEIVARR